MGRTSTHIAVLVAVGAVVAGCDASAEQMAEEAIESGSDEDVDVEFDSDSGEVSVESDEGSVHVGGDVPDELADVPLPDDFEFATGATVDSGGHDYSATGHVPGDVESVWDEMVSFYEDNASDVTTEPEMRTIRGTVNDGELGIDVMVIGNPDVDEKGTVIQVSVGTPE